MKKKICVALGLMMMMGCMMACGSAKEESSAPEATVEETQAEETETASEYVTYEFETYDGDTVVIDASNIVSQEKDENPLESAVVPAEAEVIAPGRDYVYLADDAYYYVEDAVNNLVTVANKGVATSSAAEGEVYTTDDYSFSYTNGTFEVNEARGGMVRASYCKEGVQAIGSNEIIITKEEGATVDDIVTAVVGDDSMDNVSDGSLGANMIPVKIYTRTSESPADNSATLVDTMMFMQSGDDVIMVNPIRTVGQDEETEMTIDGAFTYTLESFVLNN